MADQDTPKTCPVTTCNGLQERLKSDYDTYGSWAAVSRKCGISKGLAYRIAKQGYEPKSPALRFKLGLPAYIPVPACPTCGQAHVKAYPRPKKPPKSLYDWPPKLLLWALEHREVIQEAKR